MNARKRRVHFKFNRFPLSPLIKHKAFTSRTPLSLSLSFFLSFSDCFCVTTHKDTHLFAKTPKITVGMIKVKPNPNKEVHPILTQHTQRSSPQSTSFLFNSVINHFLSLWDINTNTYLPQKKKKKNRRNEKRERKLPCPCTYRRSLAP